MPYEDWFRHSCRVCGRKREPDERLSARGKCVDCGNSAMLAEVAQLRRHRGPYFDHWLRRCRAAFGVTLDE